MDAETARNETAWKVVKRIRDIEAGETLVSAYARGAGLVEYSPEKWVEAPNWLAEHGLHLTVIEDLDEAYQVMLGIGSSELWQAEVEGRVVLPPWRFSTSEDAMESWEMWVSSNAHLTGRMQWYTGFARWLTGTAMVKKAKLVEKVATSRDGWLKRAGDLNR